MPLEPATYTITILGAVQKPGVYEFKAGQTVSLIWMIYAKTEGPGPPPRYANERAVEITRTSKLNPAGESVPSETIRVDLRAIFTGKATDIKLEPGDVINVLSSTKEKDDKAPGLIAGL